MTRISWAAPALLFLTTAATGCATPPEQVGHIDVSLTATGPGGATYRLPPDTSLELFSDSFSDTFPLDGDGSSLSLQVPVGTFGAFLVNPGGFGSTWPLIRQSVDGSTDTVQATLDPIPSVTVAENQTAPVTIHFHVADSTVITFGHGSIAVSISVDGTGAASRFALTLDAQDLSFTGTATDHAPPELAGRFPENGSRVGYTAGVETTGPFTLAGPGVVCAPANMRERGTTAELGDFITEATSPETTKVCISQFSPDAVGLLIQSNRVGPPVTALLSDLTSQVVAVNYGVQATFNAFLFDGTTLQLGPLLGTQSVNMTLFGNVFAFRGDGTGFEAWYGITADSVAPGTSSFSPLPSPN